MRGVDLLLRDSRDEEEMCRTEWVEYATIER